MKLRFLLFMMALVMAFSQELQAQNARLLILRPSGTVTHQWVYMPSSEIMTQQGLKNNQYPLTKLPTETFIESEFITIDGCDLEMSVRYYVATKSTHSIKIELIDESGNVAYSFENETPKVNTSTMTVGDVATIGILEDVKRVKIRLSLSKAYNETEAIDIDELELYSKNGNGVETIAMQPFNITTDNQGVIIDSENNSIVEVYSLSGTHIKTNAIHVGVNRINISSGFYLLNIEGKTYKVIVP